MEKYSINDLAEMSGLTTRTLRNYIKMGILNGSKENGAWEFSAEDFEQFLLNDSVKASITAHHHSMVYDFLLDTSKPNQEGCMIQDDVIQLDQHQEAAEKTAQLASEMQDKIKFNLALHKNHLRIIVKGKPEDILAFVTKYKAYNFR